MPKCRTVTLEQGTAHQKHSTPFSDHIREINESKANIQKLLSPFRNIGPEKFLILKDRYILCRNGCSEND